MGSPLFYFDFAATTFVSELVSLEMKKTTAQVWGNASGLHQAAQKSSAAISTARRKIANILQVATNEIIFTSGGSEANNLSLKGQVISWNQQGIIPHILSSKLEHASIVKSLEQLVALGWATVGWVDCKQNGTPDVDDLEAKITEATKLGCFMAVSNETGAVFPIKKISGLLKPKGIHLHIDAVQATVTENLAKLAGFADTLSLSAHKFYGPKGIGLLYKAQDVELTPLITGGAQENALRAGTENTPAILGMAKALDIAQADLASNKAYFKALKDPMLIGVKNSFPKAIVLCEATGASHIVSVLFCPHEASRILRKLDLKGFQLASGSACSTGNPEPSASILAMGYTPLEAKSLVRVSFGLTSTKEEIDMLLNALKEVLNG
ncbi:MAG: cysteine desulfurase family protein [SAR324 cluster bacterium]|nr:cysteine desulfurase family protein [SAR324 cluster bacterium]